MFIPMKTQGEIESAVSEGMSLHHDISTLTGEEVVLFTRAGSPVFREAKKQ